MRIIVLLLGLLWASTALAEAQMRQVVVTGTGVVSAAPDMGIVRLGVTREARTASQAMADTSVAAASVLAEIKAAGIAPKDVQTASINLSPIWDNSKSGPPQVRGYVASNNLTVRVRDLDGLGGLLDALIADGANALNGLSFTIAEPGPIQTQARALAVKDAREKAQTLASAAEISLGPVLRITEGNLPAAPSSVMRGAIMEASSVPISAGEVDIRVSVTMTYGIAE